MELVTPEQGAVHKDPCSCLPSWGQAPYLALPPVLLEELVVLGVVWILQPEEPARGQEAVGDLGLQGAGAALCAARVLLLDLPLHHLGNDAVQDVGNAVVL